MKHKHIDINRYVSLKRVIGLITAILLLITGAGICQTSSAQAATAKSATGTVRNVKSIRPKALAAAATCINPMDAATPSGSDGGFTIKTTGDASFGNSELEGSMAIGGKVAFTKSDGSYAIFQSSAGNGNYTVPTIDGDNTRVLLNGFAGLDDTNSFNETTKNPVQVETGHNDNGQNAVAKLVNTASNYSFMTAYGTGTTYSVTGGTNQSPQLQSEGSAWDGKTGNPSMQAKGDFTGYFPNDHSSLVTSSSIAWKTPTVSGTSGQQNITLDSTGWNQLDYSQIAGIQKFSLGRTDSTVAYTKSPLIIHVSQKDIDADGNITLPSYLNGGSDDPDQVSSILWDFTGVTGTVNILGGDGVDVRGSILAPSADIVFPATPASLYEGQVIAKTFRDYAQGKEIHTNLFGGRSCSVAAATGGFSVRKALSGVDASAFPEGTVFSVTASWTQDGAQKSQDFQLKPDGTVVAGPQDLPVGTVVSFSEAKAPSADGYTFQNVKFSPESVTIGDGTDPVVTATNTYSKNVGGFQIRKVLKDAAGLVSSDAVFKVDYYLNGSQTPAGTLSVKAGQTVAGPQDLAQGTKVSFKEQAPSAVDGGTWAPASIDPGSIVIGDGTDPVVTVTNELAQNVGGFQIRKVLKDAAGLVSSDAVFKVDYYLNGSQTPAGTLSVKAGQTVAGPQDLAQGTKVSFKEQAPSAVDGGTWAPASIDPGSIVIGDGTDPVVTVTNELAQNVGGFQIRKALSGIDASNFPAGTVFTVTASWSQNGTQQSQDFQLKPDGTIVSGPQNLPMGTVVSFSESKVPSVDGYGFSNTSFSSQKITIGDGTNPVITVTNTYTKNLAATGTAVLGVLGASLVALLAGTAFTILRRRNK
ncbi:MAG: DUF5979 domain-containing protein [Bifidobacterium sp.]|jgi:hypothetical protein|nr:DUF5979 domain-containing protein [Bifidobacterium sp.]